MLSLFSAKQSSKKLSHAPCSPRNAKAALLLKLKLTRKASEVESLPVSKNPYLKTSSATVVPSEDCKVSDLRSSFLRRLSHESLQYISDQHSRHSAKSQEEKIVHRAVTTLMGRVYQQLDSLAFEFNEKIGWSGLQVTSTSPELVTEVLSYNRLREATQKVTHLRARFSTRHTSLVIRAAERKVDFILMPVDRVIGLSRAEDVYKPIVTLTVALNAQEEIEWEVDGKPLSLEHLEIVCLELFAKLIESSREELCKLIVA